MTAKEKQHVTFRELINELTDEIEIAESLEDINLAIDSMVEFLTKVKDQLPQSILDNICKNN